MATTQQRLEATIGSLIVQNCDQAAQIEALANNLTAANAKITELEQKAEEPKVAAGETQ
jgi:outer membrane murein-binding lipoprotein Lpp